MKDKERIYLKKIDEKTAIEVEKIELELTQKQKQMLWAILNQAQAFGLQNVGNLLKTYNKTPRFLMDWIDQTQEEYDFINELKTKLCKGFY